MEGPKIPRDYVNSHHRNRRRRRNRNRNRKRKLNRNRERSQRPFNHIRKLQHKCKCNCTYTGRHSHSHMHIPRAYTHAPTHTQTPALTQTEPQPEPWVKRQPSLHAQFVCAEFPYRCSSAEALWRPSRRIMAASPPSSEPMTVSCSIVRRNVWGPIASIVTCRPGISRQWPVCGRQG